MPSATYRASAFLEAARRLDIALTVASERPSTFEDSHPSGLLTLDLATHEKAAEQAADFASRYPLTGVLGVDDDTVVAAAAIAKRLRLPGNSIAAALAARDKHLQRELLARRDVPIPGFVMYALHQDPEELAPAVRYPCVLKPLRLAASRGVMRADDPPSFVAAFRRIAAILREPDVAACGPPARRILVEDFVAGPEVALEGLLYGGRLHVLALFDKPDPLNGPFFEETIYVTPSRLPESARAALAAVARQATTALGLTEGPVHAELRYTGKGPVLIEVAARPIGGRCSSALAFGKGEGGSGRRTTLEEIVIRHALGMALPELEREPGAAGVMMIPVPGAGVLREVRGVESAGEVPLIESVEITAHPGQRLVPWPEGSRYPGFIFSRGETPEAVEAALRAAHRRLEFVLD